MTRVVSCERPADRFILLLAGLALLGLIWAYCRPAPRVAGQTFYVSLSGHDGSAGSATAPWRTISTAVSRLLPGDRLCIGAGTWTGGMDVIDSQQFVVPSGTSWDSAVTIGGCNGEVPTVTPPAGLSAVRLTTGAPHYLIVSDLAFDGSLQVEPPFDPTVGYIRDAPELLYTSNGAHHIRFERLSVAHTMSHAVQLSSNNSDPHTPTAIEFLDSVFSDIGNASGDSGHGGPGINNGYAIYTFTAGALLRGNRFTDTRGTAVVVYGPGNVIADNRFEATGTRGGPSHALNIGSSSHPIPSVDNVVVNNVFAHTKMGGVQVYTNASATVVNNTFVDAAWAVHFQYCLGGSVVNNIFQQLATDLVNDSASTCPVSAMSNLPSTVDPQFVDAAHGDFRLRGSSSPAFNTGQRLARVVADADGVSRPQADVYDLGAYELPAEDPTPTTPSVRTTLLPSLSSPGLLVSPTPVVVQALVCTNPNSGRVYVQLVDSATGQVLTPPVWAPGIAGGTVLPLTGLALPFPTGLTLVASTGPTSVTPPPTPISCNLQWVTR